MPAVPPIGQFRWTSVSTTYHLNIIRGETCRQLLLLTSFVLKGSMRLVGKVWISYDLDMTYDVIQGPDVTLYFRFFFAVGTGTASHFARCVNFQVLLRR